jgi:hypothetical protein
LRKCINSSSEYSLSWITSLLRTKQLLILAIPTIREGCWWFPAIPWDRAISQITSVPISPVPIIIIFWYNIREKKKSITSKKRNPSRYSERFLYNNKEPIRLDG